MVTAKSPAPPSVKTVTEPVVAKVATPPVAAKKVVAKKVVAKKVLVKKVAAKKVARKVAAPAPKAVVAPKPVKVKLVRDSFTMPRADFDLIDQLKERALGFKRPTKKSELLRAGLHVLLGLSDAQLQAALGALTPLKAGRPKNAAKD